MFIPSILIFCFYISTVYSVSFSERIYSHKFQLKERTEITVIGTVHYETDNLISDSLLEIFLKIKPDVIFFESDSSYFSSVNELDDDIKDEFLETKAITAYKVNNALKLIPYDLPGRDDYMNEYNRVTAKANLFYDIRNLLQNRSKNYSPEFLKDYETLLKLSSVMSEANITFINSIEGSKKIDSINLLTYEGIARLINSEKELSGYEEFWQSEIDFWNKRNNIMLENILGKLKTFQGKRIIVLCGFAHKNFLKSGLEMNLYGENVSVKEFWEY